MECGKGSYSYQIGGMARYTLDSDELQQWGLCGRVLVTSKLLLSRLGQGRAARWPFAPKCATFHTEIGLPQLEPVGVKSDTNWKATAK